MSPITILLFDCFLLCLLFFLAGGNQYGVPMILDCANDAIYNTNSNSGRVYRSNLDVLLSALISNASRPNGFYNFTAGSVDSSDHTAVYGLFLCRGDVKPDACQECVAAASNETLRRCPDRNIAAVWYDNCMLRYSNRSIFSWLDASISWSWSNANNVTETALLNRVLGDTMDQIAINAAKNDISGKKFSVQEANFSTFERRVYALGQCTPDLSSMDCERCLGSSISYLPTCCSNRQGGRVITRSCNIRYETYPFYDISTPPPPPPAPTPNLPLPPPPHLSPASSKENGRISTRAIVAIAVPIFAAFAILPVIFCIARRSRKAQTFKIETTGASDFATTAEFLQFKFSEIQACTNNFAVSNRVGAGGFGPVYKGTLPNGQDIAVKRLSKTSSQGTEEFVNEIALVAKLQHRNLVRLLGYCLEGEEKMLIYEFVPNKSLDYFLFDPEKQPLLDWSTRYKIMGGIARGLLYLHEDSQLKIVHRDLKASNVLLDQNMNPKIADFGTARLFEFDQSEGNTSKIAGTFGYMAPEYAFHGLFSVKSDVFSFGVLMLEIISGKKNNSFRQSHGDDLLSYGWRQWRDGTPLALVDPSLGEFYTQNQVIKSIHVGLLCVQEDVEQRPVMASVVLMLNSYSGTLPAPKPPAFFGRSRTQSFPRELTVAAESESSKSSRPDSSINEASITELYPR